MKDIQMSELKHITCLNGNKQTLYDIKTLLASANGFSSFMCHCFKEFSAENLLSVLEFTQYQIWICSNVIMVEGMDDIRAVFPYILKLPMDELPKSTLVYEEDEEKYDMNYDLMYDRIQKLYVKYIGGSGEFELNLSYGLKKSVDKNMAVYEFFPLRENDAQMESMYHFFDKIITSIICLMMDSYQRFSKNNACLQCIENSH